MELELIGALLCAAIAGFCFGHNRGYRKGAKTVLFVGAQPSPKQMLAIAKAITEAENDNDSDCNHNKG
ncbi:MAG: hypothetical protein AMJ46_12480 [Latescibacteria bacterium DG_63]|nr:MAG: hypothetical protein AMJ46_12480 [Latescibacteria bacterium DG_63]